MESNSQPMRIHISETTANLLTLSGIALTLEDRGEMDIKGKGKMHTYFVDDNSSYLATADKFNEERKKAEIEKKNIFRKEEDLTVEV
jgi:hypothetical protein